MVGLFESEPYEVFAGKQTKVEVDEALTQGVIVKAASGRYYLKANGTKINIKEVFENPEQAAMTRMISMNLRHGTDTIHVVEQLEKSEDTIVDFSKAVARVLKKYIKDRSVMKLSKKCPNCGSTNVDHIFQSGCTDLLCKDCGSQSSKCG
jgi:ribosomal protein S27E